MRLIDGDALYERLVRMKEMYPDEQNAVNAMCALVRNAKEVDSMTSRLMELREIRGLNYKPIYLETRDKELELYCTHFWNLNGLVWLNIPGFEHPISFDPATYGSEWRLWTWEPTKKQSEKEEWKDESVRGG